MKLIKLGPPQESALVFHIKLHERNKCEWNKAQTSESIDNIRCWNLRTGTHHLHWAVFRVVEQLVSPQESRAGVVPLSQKGKALLLCITQQTQQNTLSSQAWQGNVTDLTLTLGQGSPHSRVLTLNTDGQLSLLTCRVRGSDLKQPFYSLGRFTPNGEPLSSCWKHALNAQIVKTQANNWDSYTLKNKTKVLSLQVD